MNKLVPLIFTVLILGCKPKASKEAIQEPVNKGNKHSIVSKNALAIAKIDSSQLPQSVKYLGTIKNAVSWKDNIGVNYVITTESNEYPSPGNEEGEDFRNADLYAYHYVLNGEKVKMHGRFTIFLKIVVSISM